MQCAMASPSQETVFFVPEIILWRLAPMILDPANPTNNLYETGFGKRHDYDKGDGNWTQLVANIDTIDLTKTVKEIQLVQ